MIWSQGPTPGNGASIATHRLMRSGWVAANRETDHDADIMRHEFGRTHAQGVQYAHHVQRLILLVVAAIRL